VEAGQLLRSQANASIATVPMGTLEIGQHT
jgi:hypothetical protein